MNVGDVGEFGLIARLARIVGSERPDVVVGIGDDVAVLDVGGPRWLVATVDAHVEGVHFLRHLITPQQLGRRALAVNISDIAATGGEPAFALVSLVLSESEEVEWLEELYRGLRAEAERAGVAVVGGNIARSPGPMIIDITLLGHVRPEHMLRRNGARPGDVVLVTGTLGDAAAGLRLLLNPSPDLAAPYALPVAEREALVSRLMTPTPRLAESRVVARAGLATAMVDISDGLSSDVGHICTASRVGVRLWADRLPVSDSTRRVACLLGVPAWELALSGGEDYELCFTVPRRVALDLAARVTNETGTPVTAVGEVLPPEAGRRLVLPGGQDVPLEARGWEHFAPPS
ncbi:MAG: thiamine-phosphate kinase [Ardenticatenia bacterium]|nr:thiamine-phosphate kinase [Ardenticatenia bacterium]